MILLTVPLGFVGVVAALLVTGSNLSIMSFMGIIMMVGIVVEYSIVLVDFANQRLAEGMSIHEAIIDAAKVRARPILMTSLTTWLALLPMAIGGFGGDANAPLARGDHRRRDRCDRVVTAGGALSVCDLQAQSTQQSDRQSASERCPVGDELIA